MSNHFLHTHFSLKDLKSLPVADLDKLASEIRQKIITTLAINGGHLASNLGIIELTIALHKVFESPDDKFVFDTSHQTYTHKIVTGRNYSFSTLRKHLGISGFSHPQESAHDHFYSGHAGTAFSTALGLAKNRDFFHRDEHIIPILGDASFNCGITMEAFNHIPENMKNFILVLNDNKMAISKNVGNIKNILSRLLNNPTSNKLYQEIQSVLAKVPAFGKLLAKQGQKITESIKNLVSPAPFFEQYGLAYVGPIDGHDIKKLIETFSALKNISRPVIVHVLTTKGKGMPMATQHPTCYHGAKPFDVVSGKFHKSLSKKPTFPKIFGKQMVEMAKIDSSMFAMSPAMLEGSCLTDFENAFPDRCLDVGIAESHGVTFAGGLARKGKVKVVACIYSTFLQRAFDNIFHDVCLQNIPMVFAIDRAGINGPDGVTHHGIYDISFLQTMPNMIIAQPRNGHILKELMKYAFTYQSPIAIRYPNATTEDSSHFLEKRELGKAEVINQGKQILIIAVGTMCQTAIEVKDILSEHNISPTIVDPIFLKPFDKKLFSHLLDTHSYVVTIEEHVIQGGFASLFNSFIVQNHIQDVQIVNIGILDTFVQHGKTEELKKSLGLDAKSIASRIIKDYQRLPIEEKHYDYSPLPQ